MASFFNNIWFIFGVIGFLAGIGGLIAYFLGYRSTWVWIVLIVGFIVGILGMILAYVTSRGEQTKVVNVTGVGPTEFGIDYRGPYARPAAVVTTPTTVTKTTLVPVV